VIVEGAGVEPEAVDGAAEGVAFEVGEETAVGVVVLPFLEWVDVFVALGYSTGLDDLLKEHLRYGYLTMSVRRLRCVLRQKLQDILDRSVLGICGFQQNEQPL
jgi:hypothetical protein